MSATKTTTRAVKNRATKVSTKAVPTLFYATTLADALGGKFGVTLQRFYVSACSYHLKALTVFPRARHAATPLLSETDTLAFLERHAKCSIPAGSAPAQRLFDEMMVQTQAKVK